MITREEIDAKSQEFEIHQANIQRDYVFGWLLCGLFTVSSLKDQLFLKGGNALRKGYFDQTRFSSDLDFGIPGDVSSSLLLSEINKVCEFVSERAGVGFLLTDNRIQEKFVATEAPIPGLRVYEVRVYFKDFYGHADHITIKVVMDITRFDRVMLPLQKVALLHPYSDQSDVACEISCMKLEEIIATKLKCVLQRQHAPDLFDYAYSIKVLGGSLDKGEVVRALVRKTIFERNPHVLKRILQTIPLDYAREYWPQHSVRSSGNASCRGCYRITVRRPRGSFQYLSR